jgi:hypothetical protein
MRLDGPGGEILIDPNDELHFREGDEEWLQSLRLPDDLQVIMANSGVLWPRGAMVGQFDRWDPECAETCSGLRHASQEFAPYSVTMMGVGDLADREAGVIFLMRRAMELFGDERQARQALKSAWSGLAPGGVLIVESVVLDPEQSGYASGHFVWDYDGCKQGPFQWGGGNREWMNNILQDMGARWIKIHERNGGGECEPYLIAAGKTKAAPGKKKSMPGNEEFLGNEEFAALLRKFQSETGKEGK